MYRACLVNLHPHYISGQQYLDAVWDIPYSFDPDGFVEPAANVHSLSSHLLHGKFLDLFKCPRGTLLEAHSMDELVDVDGVLSGYYLVDGRTALHLTPLLCGSHYNRPRLERKSMRDCGRLNRHFSKENVQMANRHKKTKLNVSNHQRNGN